MSYSGFRELMNLWEQSSNPMKAKAMIEENGLIMIFKKDGKIYGTPESGRVAYARMQDGEDADFMAFDLNAAMEGKKLQIVLGQKDLKDIKIINQEQAEKELSGNGEVPKLTDPDDHEPEEPGIPMGEE